MCIDLFVALFVGAIVGGFIVYEWLDSSGNLKDKG